MVIIVLSTVCLAGPDDDYLALFARLREADRAAESGQTAPARQAYTDVQGSLMSLQREYPEWNPEVVAFRLRYVKERLATLAPETGQPEGEATGNASGPTLSERDQGMQLLLAKLRQVELERDEYKARLQEALAPKPAPINSPELLRAEARIRSLEQEVTLLRQANESAADDPSADGHGLTESNSSSLSAEIEALRAQLTLERQKVVGLETRVAELLARSAAAGPGQAPTTDETASIPIPEESSAAPTDDLATGQSLLEAGDVSGAILILSQVAEREPESVEVHAVLGQALLLQGMIDPAEAVLERALQLDANNAEAHREMARLVLLRTPPSQSLARWHYQEARRLGIDPDPDLEALLANAKPGS